LHNVKHSKREQQQGPSIALARHTGCATLEPSRAAALEEDVLIRTNTAVDVLNADHHGGSTSALDRGLVKLNFQYSRHHCVNGVQANHIVDCKLHRNAVKDCLYIEFTTVFRFHMDL
jgi:hypothetical protein